jgi:hypothetical protein
MLMAKVVGTDVLHPDPLKFIFSAYLRWERRNHTPRTLSVHVCHDTHFPLLFRVHFRVYQYFQHTAFVPLTDGLEEHEDWTKMLSSPSIYGYDPIRNARRQVILVVVSNLAFRAVNHGFTKFPLNKKLDVVSCTHSRKRYHDGEERRPRRQIEMRALTWN